MAKKTSFVWSIKVVGTGSPDQYIRFPRAKYNQTICIQHICLRNTGILSDFVFFGFEKSGVEYDFVTFAGKAILAQFAEFNPVFFPGDGELYIRINNYSTSATIRVNVFGYIIDEPMSF